MPRSILLKTAFGYVSEKQRSCVQSSVVSHQCWTALCGALLGLEGIAVCPIKAASKVPSQLRSKCRSPGAVITTDNESRHIELQDDFDSCNSPAAPLPARLISGPKEGVQQAAALGCAWLKTSTSTLVT